MSLFASKLVVEDDNGFPFTLVSPLVYDSAVLGTTVTVPAGFRTDFASIPKVLWNILSPVASYDRAAVVHDFLYHTAPAIPSGSCSRKQADDTLLEAMDVCGTSRLVRYAIYFGVRAGGAAIWARYRAKDSR